MLRRFIARTRKIDAKSARSNSLCALCATAVALLLLTGFGAAAQDSTPAYSVLYSFPLGWAAGGNPEAGLIADADGNLYGTTVWGGNTSSSSCLQGSLGCGVVFKLDPQGHETVIYAFSGGADGSEPGSSVTRDAAGNLYGTTFVGGSTGGQCDSDGCGVVFQLDETGAETILHTFVGPEGQEPLGALVPDGNRSLYGVTFVGGSRLSQCAIGKCGVVFKLGLNEHSYHVVHFFSGGDDGGNPGAGLIRDAAGNLYGTTWSGGTGSGSSCPYGSDGCGVVFEMDASGNETELYNFTGGADGFQPGTLLRDPTGNSYGTTEAGGSTQGVCADFQGCGVVFKVDPSGVETVLYSFQGGGDGAVPVGGLVRDSAGNLYGTTFYGGYTGSSCIYGSRGCGVIFRLDPSGNETVLHTFTGGADGSNPAAGLLLYKGSLYGTAEGGGHGLGVVFSIKL